MTTTRKVAPLGIAVRTVIGVMALVLSIGVFVVLESTRPEAPRRERVEHGKVVRVVTATPVHVERGWDGYGTARALRSADVSAQVSERVIERPDGIEEGVRVSRGDLIARLDPAAFEDRVAQNEQAVARLAAGLDSIDIEEPKWRRALELAQDSVRITRDEIAKLRLAVEEGGGSLIEIDRLERELTRQERESNELSRQVALIEPRRAELRAQKRSAESALETAQRDLELTRITAPIPGVLQSLEVEVGEWVSVGAPVARIVNLSRIEIPVRLALSSAATLRVGDRAVVWREGSSIGRRDGRVTRIAPEADASRRSLTVFVEVEQDVPTDRPPGLMPGAFVRATVFDGRGAERLVVPRNAINGDRVMIVDDAGLARTRRVSIAYYIEGAFARIHPIEREWAVLEGGLDRGERVIISNLDEVHDGELIAAVDVREGEVADRAGGDGGGAAGAAGGRR